MTLQEILDKVSAHLVKQGKAAEKGMFCYYRLDGLMCAAGCLIPDKLYNEKLELRPIDSPIFNYVWTALEIDKDGINFIRALQIIHDYSPVGMWKSKLRQLATKHKLMIPQCIAKD